MKTKLTLLVSCLVLGASTASAQVIRREPVKCDLTPEQASVGAYLAENVTDPVKVVYTPQPVYPAALRVAGIQGKVTLKYVVDETGKAESCSIAIVSSSNEKFNDSAIATILNSRFKPGDLNGTPVRQQVTQTINYTIAF